MLDTLRFCPLCGGRAGHSVSTNDTRVANRFVIICLQPGCGASSGWKQSPEKAAASWNTRYADPIEIINRSRKAVNEIQQKAMALEDHLTDEMMMGILQKNFTP